MQEPNPYLNIDIKNADLYRQGYEWGLLSMSHPINIPIAMKEGFAAARRELNQKASA